MPASRRKAATARRNGAAPAPAPTHETLAEKAAEVLRRLAAYYGPLKYHQRFDPVSELVFTILSQNVNDENSSKASQRLRAAYPTWEQVMDAPVERIRELVHPAGLGEVKAPRIQEALRYIVEKRGRLELDFLKEMPLEEAKAWLRSIKGVGPKTAAIVLCFALGMPAMPVDTHVYRVSQRLGLIGQKASFDQAHEILESIMPQSGPAIRPRDGAPPRGEDAYAFHVRLITHGRRICHALRPECARCVLNDICPTAPVYLPERAAAKAGKATGAPAQQRSRRRAGGAQANTL